MSADIIRPTEFRGFTWHLSSGGTLNCAPLEDDDRLFVFDMSRDGGSSGTIAYCDTIAEAEVAAKRWLLQRGLCRVPAEAL